MEFSRQDHESYSVITITDEIDLLEAPNLRAVLDASMDAKQRVLILDLSEVSFIDSSGLSELIRYRHSASEHGRFFFIAGARSEILELFSIAGLSEFFQLFVSLEDACAEASRQQ